MKKIKFWFECRLLGKHRFDFYTGKCIVCSKTDKL